MGHHINDKGEFESNKYPDLGPDKIVLSFKDELARKSLILYSQMCYVKDKELALDIVERLNTIEK